MPPKARPHHLYMSWPSDKPPWKHVKWCTYGTQNTSSIINWIYPPNPEWSILLPFPITPSDLYVLKHQIEELDKIGEWEFLKRSSNPYELVFSQSQDPRIPSSICSLRPLSRSFFKMIEILNVLDFFKRHKTTNKTTIRSAHVCEGPGGFIEALLHLSSKHNFVLENACAMTLKPSKPNIPGWKRAYNFLKKSPMLTIEYGSDDTGDIMVHANQLEFLKKCRGKCNIFTADGGFDFSEHYETQEDEVFPLLISSVLVGLQTLVKGGDFILKVFDTELKSTKDLIVLLSLCFDNWTLYKPALSRPCNAEKYFLGKGCRVIPTWIMITLNNIRDTYSKGILNIKSIFPELPSDIDQQVNTFRQEYLEQQVAALKYAILHKIEWNKTPDIIWNSIYNHSMSWCQEFQMPIRHDHLTAVSRICPVGVVRSE